MCPIDALVPTEIAASLAFGRDGQVLLKPERVALLEHIQTSGSISAAARAIPMSYKAAWDAIDAMNNLAPEPLVERVAGGQRGGGSRLTAYGARMVAHYRAIERLQRQLVDLIASDDPAVIGDLPGLGLLFGLRTTARNLFSGRVARVAAGAVSSEVVVDIGARDRLVAIVGRHDVEALRLAPGAAVLALIQATQVMLATADAGLRTSARNRLDGTITAIEPGAVNAEVQLALAGGKRLSAMLTLDALSALGLEPGRPCTAWIKASSIVLAAFG